MADGVELIIPLMSTLFDLLYRRPPHRGPLSLPFKYRFFCCFTIWLDNFTLT